MRGLLLLGGALIGASLLFSNSDTREENPISQGGIGRYIQSTEPSGTAEQESVQPMYNITFDNPFGDSDTDIKTADTGTVSDKTSTSSPTKKEMSTDETVYKVDTSGETPISTSPYTPASTNILNAVLSESQKDRNVSEPIMSRAPSSKKDEDEKNMSTESDIMSVEA